jgi:hypothetical protein
MIDLEDLKEKTRKLIFFKEDAFFGRIMIRSLRKLKIADSNSTLIYLAKYTEFGK